MITHALLPCAVLLLPCAVLRFFDLASTLALGWNGGVAQGHSARASRTRC